MKNVYNFQIAKVKPHGFERCLALRKQPSIGVLREKCSENMQQIYSRTPMRQNAPKCDLNKVITFRYGCSPVNLPFIFRTPFLRTPLEGWFWLLLDFCLFQAGVAHKKACDLKCLYPLGKSLNINNWFVLIN